MAGSARTLAFRLLLRVEDGGATLAELLVQPDVDALPSRDRGFLHELVLGTLRHRGALDVALAAVLERSLRELDPPTLALLRLGAYQLLRMRVPAHAAVSESVDLARSAQPRAAGLVNAALRRLAREGPPAAPDPRADPMAWLTTEGSLPGWLAKRWLDRLGADLAVSRARAFLAVPPTRFRLNPRVEDALARVKDAGLDPKAHSVPDAWEVGSGSAKGAADAGILYIQDAGSQLAARLCARPGLVLDACAAPGGKALLMADLVPPPGRVVAMEASPRRLLSLTKLARRWGSPASCLGGDALRPPFSRRFDAVLLDAPCSGLGTLGRHPDIRWRMREEEISRHAARQAALLESVSRLLEPGGRLVYSVCSPEPEEGEEVVRAFLSRQRHEELGPGPLPDWAHPFLAPDGFLRTGPEGDGGDAFFVAVLERRR